MPMRRKDEEGRKDEGEGGLRCHDDRESDSFRQAIEQVRAGHLTANGPLVTAWLRDPAARHVSSTVAQVLERGSQRGPILLPPSGVMPLLP